MKQLEDLIGFTIIDVAERRLSKRVGLVVKKGNKLYLIEKALSEDKTFCVSDLKLKGVR